MQDQYLPADVVKSTFRRLRSKADNKVSKPRHPSDRGNRIFLASRSFVFHTLFLVKRGGTDLGFSIFPAGRGPNLRARSLATLLVARTLDGWR